MEQLTLTRDRMHYEQPLPACLIISHYDNSLTNRPSKLNECVHDYIQSTNNKEIFDLQKGILHIHCHLTKISFLIKL